MRCCARLAAGPRRARCRCSARRTLRRSTGARVARDRQQIAAMAVRQRRAAERARHGGRDVEKIDDLRAALACGHAPGPAQDQRHAHRILVQRVLPPQAALAQLVAVIGRVDDERVVGEPLVCEARAARRRSARRAATRARSTPFARARPHWRRCRRCRDSRATTAPTRAVATAVRRAPAAARGRRSARSPRATRRRADAAAGSRR